VREAAWIPGVRHPKVAKKKGNKIDWIKSSRIRWKKFFILISIKIFKY
jgi:hypothetical protein